MTTSESWFRNRVTSGYKGSRLTERLVVAIDGGAGTGKSAVCSAVGAQLGIPYFNAGLMYRAFALWCLTSGVPVEGSGEMLAAAAASLEIGVALDRGTRVTLMRVDVSDRLKDSEVSAAVPFAAANDGVRRVMNERQRSVVQAAVAKYGGVVIDGRDATSLVVPDAEVKILLTATPEAKRLRYGSDAYAMEALRRDTLDAQSVNFETRGSDVCVVDTSTLALPAVIVRVLALVEAATGRTRILSREPPASPWIGQFLAAPNVYTIAGLASPASNRTAGRG